MQPSGLRAAFAQRRRVGEVCELRKRLRFLSEQIWLSPHGRARRRAQLARAKPEGGPEVGRRSAYALVICRRASGEAPTKF